jgi:hypothetical protein
LRQDVLIYSIIFSEINCHKQNLLEPEDEVRRVYHNCSNDSDGKLQDVGDDHGRVLCRFFVMRWFFR